MGKEYLWGPVFIQNDADPHMHVLGRRMHAHVALRLGGSAD